MSNNVAKESTEQGFLSSYVQAVLRVLIYIGILAAVLFLCAGTVNWWMAWVYFGIWALATMVGMAYMLSRFPDLVAERTNPGDNAKSWDKPYVLFLVLLGPVLVEILAGLDFRFGWLPDFPAWVQVAALIPWLLAYGLVVWAMKTNRFFSSVVRIQADRDHQVIAGGPYAFVRHPGYTSGMISALMIPMILGSPWAYLGTLLIVIVFVIRTRREDRTLHDELAGYLDYAGTVRYRLIPGIW